MALRGKSLFLYGFEVTTLNSSVDFKNASGGPEIRATLRLGFYSLTSLGIEIVRAMQAADPANLYSFSVDRTYNGGIENRITISTSGIFLSLLFGSGSRAASTVAPLIGFSGDQTGLTAYISTASAGTVLIPDLVFYNYLPTTHWRKVQGTVNITASGQKEAIVFQIQRFLQFQVKYEPEAKVIVEWTPFIDWIIQQRLWEFTPDYASAPSTYHEVTLERSSDDGKGLGFKFTEMLPNFPFNYDTGVLMLRERQD
jgi:hypothetical protein